MASFISSLSQNSDAIAIFVNDKYDYKYKKSVLSKQQIETADCNSKFQWPLEAANSNG